MSVVERPRVTSPAPPTKPWSQGLGGPPAGPTKTIHTPRPLWQKLPWGRVLAGLAVLFGGGWLLSGASAWWSADLNQTTLVYHTVKREDLAVTIIERGNLESQDDVPVFCEVDDFRRDGINGTPIVWIIPNGSVVEKGELLVELDSAPIQEELDEQTLDTQQARELLLLAKARYDNQQTQNETNLAEAELDVKLAKLELQMFEDETNGTHRLEVEEIERQIEDLNNEILAAKANLELKRNEKEGIEALFKLGYAGKSEFERSELDFLQAESLFASKVNRLKTQMASLQKKMTYEREMRLLDLDGKLATSQRNLEQVGRNNEALLTQLKATLDARQEQLDKEQELLTRYQSQLNACKIHAPQAGMVAYADGSRGEEIRAGAAVRMRQEILSIPNLSRMQVRTAVHESVLDQVKQGMTAAVRVDAFSDRSFEGTIHSVAVLPERNSRYGNDTRFYETVVEIDGTVENLKPGMTAVVEIHVDFLEAVLTVPLQAIVEQKKQTYVYVSANGQLERRAIEVGLANEHLAEVCSGLEEGDQIVLNPMGVESAIEEDSDQPDKTLPDKTLPDKTPPDKTFDGKPSGASKPSGAPSGAS